MLATGCMSNASVSTASHGNRDTLARGAAIRLIESSADGLLADPIGSPDYQPADLSYACDAAFKSAASLRNIDSVRSARYAAYGSHVVDYLLTHANNNRDGPPGWGLPYPWDAFQDGTTNPANQDYAFQDGMVGFCLLQAYQSTHDSKYISTVKAVIDKYLVHSYSSFVDLLCSDCGYFWYSTNPNDADRYVKNTNVLMGQVVSGYAKFTGDRKYSAIARQVFNSEDYEIRVRRNFCYLGYDDRAHGKYCSKDDHIVYEMWALKQIANDIHASGYAHTLLALKTAYDNCGSDCAMVDASSTESVSCIVAAERAASRVACIKFIGSRQLVQKIQLVYVNDALATI